MGRHVSTRVALRGLMVGVALSAGAAAPAPWAPAAGEGREPHASPAANVVIPDPRRSDAGAASARAHGRAQPADPRRMLRSSHLRTSTPAAERVYAEVERRARKLDAHVRTRIAREILTEAARARLDPFLVVAVIHVESSFDPHAISTAGAAGLMQLRAGTMGDVAARSGVRSTDRFDPVANIQAGVRYLAGLIQAFGDPELALMAYNAGPGRIRRHLREGGVPERFRAYPQSVAREMDRLGSSLERSDPARAKLAVADLPSPRS